MQSTLIIEGEIHARKTISKYIFIRQKKKKYRLSKFKSSKFIEIFTCQCFIGKDRYPINYPLCDKCNYIYQIIVILYANILMVYKQKCRLSVMRINLCIDNWRISRDKRFWRYATTLPIFF